jgi:GalNAc-alpha-(1->4)-GalNAc-alpha-(1->3)-diNAcBac-PP-undecaprenol alpha-1,4-N-acetyl-D-galactosaminyltransferase
MLQRLSLISPSLKLGGIERALTTLANEMSRQGISVHFISCLAGNHFYSLSKKVHLTEPPFKRKAGLFNKLITYIKLLFFIRKNVVHSRPDAVLVYGDYFAPLVLFSLIGAKQRVFVSDRMSPKYHFPWYIRLAKKWLYPIAAGFIAQSTKAADLKRKQFGVKANISVIPNMLPEFNTVKPNRKNQVLCLARLHYEKGLDRAIEAFALSRKMDWQLVLAGNGPEKENLENLSRKLGVQDQVVFAGEVKDIETLMAESSIFLLSSRSEGFPNALSEAMATGMACITFESLNDNAIITQDGFDGLLAKDNNLNDLTEKLKKLMDDSALRSELGKNALKIKDRLNTAKLTKEILNFILNDNH